MMVLAAMRSTNGCLIDYSTEVRAEREMELTIAARDFGSASTRIAFRVPPTTFSTALATVVYRRLVKQSQY